MVALVEEESMSHTLWTKADLIASLMRACNDMPYGFIVMDGQIGRNKFLKESWEMAIDKGWITVHDYEEDQYAALHGYFTDKGRKDLSYAD